jgi:Aerotolerance regulator N-terminal
MGFLSPWNLLAAFAVVVPIVLHLFHRQDTPRVVFPAIQYLLRTEREHARTIRFRQLLLLLVRTLAVLFVVFAGARPFLHGAGGVHEATALVIILDNSMSSGRVVDEERVLEGLKVVALESLARVGEEDQVWLLRAGEPWAPALQASAGQLARAVRSTQVSAAAGNISAALVRARSLVEQSPLTVREIHVVSDGQADPGRRVMDIGESAVVVLTALSPVADENTYLDSLTVGGGLAPLANEQSHLGLKVTGPNPTATVPLRLVVDGRIHGAVSGAGGTTTVLPLGPFGRGWITGFVETDPDALAADDRLYFALSIRPAPLVTGTETESLFLESALAVLESAGRVRRVGPNAAPDARLALGGADLDDSGVPTIIFPEGDPERLPALNRRLASAGVPWRYTITPVRGEARVATMPGFPVDLRGTRVRSRFQLIPGPEADTSRILARLSSGEPWIVEVTAGGGRALLLASPLEEEASSLPVTAALIPLLDWALGSWSARRGGSGDVPAGSPIPLPSGVTVVVGPSGVSTSARGQTEFEETRRAGIYDLMSESGVVARVAVNSPSSESVFLTLSRESFHAGETGSVTFVRDRQRWNRSIFVDSQGPEVGRELLGAVLLLLGVESIVAASGITRRKRESPSAADGATSLGTSEA